MKLVQSCWYAGTALSMLAGISPAYAQSADAAPEAAASDSEIIVTGSRIQRSGFDAPTPTTVIGEAELALGNRPSIAQVLNDAPQFRPTSTPTTTAGGTNSGISTADMRGLGGVRTLTLLNGHRFSGSQDLNTVPQSLVKRIDVVTGGASAAWGSGAVAGVVNIILDDDFTGWRMGAQTGLSSRGDGARYGADIAWGTDFAGGRGHFMVAGDYMDERGILSRKGRPNLEAGLFAHPTEGLIIARDPNATQIYNGGSILNGSLAPSGLVFNPDGTIGRFPFGSVTSGGTTVGGGGQNTYDYVAVSAPYKRINAFARASYELTDSLNVWAQFSFHRMTGNYGLFPETAADLSTVIMPDNAFLTQQNRQQLAAAGINGAFILGRFLDDVGPDRMLSLKYNRRNLEGAIGFEGTFGDGWKYDAYYDHGEIRISQQVKNQRIKSRFAAGVDSVLVGNTPTCRINADASTTNDDPNCVPINLFGNGNISDKAAAWAFGGAHLIATIKLDAAGASVSGQPFATWAGPVDIAVGTDVRWEKQTTDYVDPLSRANALSVLNSSATNGSFNVKEVFAEVNVPLLDAEDVARLEINGAARYSDYSTSGGIWSWKTGGTLRLVNDLLLRAVYSRDIRSPSIAEYFTTRSVGIGTVVDLYRGPNVIQNGVTVYGGGNRNLTPEISHTLTVGGSYSPHYIPGLRLSVDYYDINIDNVITSIPAQTLIAQCVASKPSDPTCGGVIVRKPNGEIESMTNTVRNLANYNTQGLDIEASYRMALGDGNLSFRALANHVFHLKVNGVDVAGIVGGETAFSTPKWRGSATVAFDNADFGANVRVRYVDGGLYSVPPPAPAKAPANNRNGSRTYVDLGLQFKAGAFTLFGNVNNLFDVDPPLTPYITPNYDVIGRYVSGGVKLNF
ncbi:TonB-dependent receptor plug domain-containing protein [Sphingopyxis sp. LARHCG72]